MFNFYFTNPGVTSLLGFEFQPIQTFNHENGEALLGDMFSIGLFFCRFDILFNLTPIEEEIDE